MRRKIRAASLAVIIPTKEFTYDRDGFPMMIDRNGCIAFYPRLAPLKVAMWGNTSQRQICTHTHTHTHTHTRSGSAEKRRKSARNRKIVVDAMRETGETWVEKEKNVEKKGLVQ